MKYIAKYASKAERRSEIYHEMLAVVAGGSGSKAPVLFAYRRFLVQMLVLCDIGAQGTCHLLLKLPLVIYSRKFFSLNVRKKVYQRVSIHSKDFLCGNNFIEVYESHPFFLEHLCLIETIRSGVLRRSVGKRNGGNTITMLSFMFGHNFMLFLMRGQKSLKCFVGVNFFYTICFVTLVQISGCLLKLFLRIGGIGDITCGMLIKALCQIKAIKRIWNHLYMKKMLIKILKGDMFFSRLVPQIYVKISKLDNLGRREFGVDYNW